jgi:sugar lactone lactonase YvrE
MSNSVQVWSPEGKLLKKIPLSAINPTCTTWGGKNWDILFVTTGRDNDKAAKGHDDGGQMFLIKAEGARGQEKYQFGG